MQNDDYYKRLLDLSVSVARIEENTQQILQSVEKHDTRIGVIEAAHMKFAGVMAAVSVIGAMLGTKIANALGFTGN